MIKQIKVKITFNMNSFIYVFCFRGKKVSQTIQMAQFDHLVAYKNIE